MFFLICASIFAGSASQFHPIEPGIFNLYLAFNLYIFIIQSNSSTIIFINIKIKCEHILPSYTHKIITI